MKRIIKFIVLMSMVVMIGGCKSNNVDTKKNSEIESSSKINIDKISWNVKQGIADGERYALLNYKNNTGYTITYFELTFKEKDNLKSEDKEKFYDHIRDTLGADEDDIKELKKKKISFKMESDRFVKKNKSIKNQKIHYYNGIFYLKDASYVDLTEPDTATISYIDKNKIYTVYYDYQSKEYTEEETTENAQYWTKGMFKDKLPKPKASVIRKDDSDDEDEFSFEAYELTLDDYYSYVEECKNMGYTLETDSYEGYYNAKNSEGYEIDIEYDEENHKLSVSIYSPDTDDDESDLDIDEEDEDDSESDEIE